MAIRFPDVVGSVVEAALSPHPVDRYLELLDPMMTWRDIRGRVTRVDHPTPRSVRLTIHPTRQWRGHQAGQYVQLSVVVNGVRHTRCFSPANAEGTGGDIELTVAAHDDGFISTHLRDHATVGTVVGLSAAAGEFTLPSTPPTSAVFVSGGSGITPVLSMLRTLLSNGYRGPITFLHYARSADDVTYPGELSEIAAAYHNVDVRLRYTRGARARRFDTEELADVEGLRDADVFVCGPRTLMDAVEKFHAEAGITRPLRSEAFTIAAPIAIDPDEPLSGELSFVRSGSSATNDGRSILDQAEAAGLSPASGCRMGICFSCTAVKRSGCTRNILTGDTDDESDTQIQLCINAPVGDVEIEV